MSRTVAFLIGIGLCVVFALATLLGTAFTVSPYERAIVTYGGAFGYIADPGFHLKRPFYDAAVFMRTDLQSVTTPVLNTYTVDNQEVDATLVIQYALPVTELAYIYTNVGDVQTKLLTMTADRWKIEAGKINVSSFSNTRGKLVTDVRTIVQTEAKRLYHVDVTDVQLWNLDYQKSYRDAQAGAAVVKTQIEQAEGLRTKAAVEAETAKISAAGTANQAIEAARGAAEAVRLAAIAQAEATRLQGAAEAGAKELMAKALTSNPVLVDYQKALKWNGALPQNIYASAPIPFMNMTGQ